MWRWRLVLHACSWLLLVAAAQAHSVAIVQPSANTLQQLELVERLRGELLAVGFGTKVVQVGHEFASDAPSKRVWIEAAARREGVDALITFWDIEVKALLAVEVWTRDATGTYQLTRVESDANRDSTPRELAIRAVEVLRAALLVAEMNSSSEAAPSGVALTELPDRVPTPPPSPQLSDGFGLAAGVVLLSTLDGGLAALPILKFEAALAPAWALHVEVSGFGYRPDIASSAGTVRIAQTHAALGARYRFLPESSLRPFLALALGAQRTEVVGHANAPFAAQAVARWSFLATAGGGAEFKFADSFYLSLTGSVHLLAPGVVVHVLDQVVAENGRPNLAAALMLGVWL